MYVANISLVTHELCPFLFFCFYHNHYFRVLQIQRTVENDEEEHGSLMQRRRRSTPSAIVNLQPQATEELVKPAPQEDEHRRHWS